MCDGFLKGLPIRDLAKFKGKNLTEIKSLNDKLILN
jgi:hypothetical protein